MTLAREGRWHTALAALAAAATAALWGWWSAPFWLWLLFTLQFFREPARRIALDDSLALAPADGRVVFVGDATEPETGERRLKIAIFMSPFHVHSNRAPASGEVVLSRRVAGRFFNAALEKTSTDNERHIVAIETPRGRVTCAQVAGFVARRVLCYLRVGDRVGQGARYGFIRFGSRVDTYLPPASAPLVAVGQKTRAGITPLARFAAAAVAEGGR